MASNPNIQTDAECEPCHGNTTRHGETANGPGAMVRRSLTSPSSNDVLKHDVKDGPIDFLIICSKEDEDDARELQKFLQAKFSCTSKILSNSVLPTDALEENLERTMFTLLYVTKSLTDCQWTRSIGPICQKRTLEDEKKQWTVVPVYTEKNSQNDLPLTLRHLDGIDYWKEDRDEIGFSNLIDSKKDELSQRRLSTSTKTEQTREKMMRPVTENKITPSAGRGEEAKREDAKAIEERLRDIALSSMLHVNRTSTSSSPLIAVDAQNSTQNDVSVDGAPAKLIKSAADSGVFSDGSMGVSSHVSQRSNTQEWKPSAEAKSSYKPKYDIPGPEDSDSN